MSASLRVARGMLKAMRLGGRMFVIEYDSQFIERDASGEADAPLTG